jgi:hypothetical protein
MFKETFIVLYHISILILLILICINLYSNKTNKKVKEGYGSYKGNFSWTVTNKTGNTILVRLNYGALSSSDTGNPSNFASIISNGSAKLTIKDVPYTASNAFSTPTITVDFYYNDTKTKYSTVSSSTPYIVVSSSGVSYNANA